MLPEKLFAGLCWSAATLAVALGSVVAVRSLTHWATVWASAAQNVMGWQ